MTTSRLYASKKLMGALLLMMGFVLPAIALFLQMHSSCVLLILWKVLIIGNN